ncbi:MAG: hypothetical protein ACTSPY_10035 [Candidatus Helarchaeota archaeon]
MEKKWSEAVKYEGYGHDYFYIKDYINAASMHQKSANIFKEIYEKSSNKKVKNKAYRNHLIEYGNYYQCLASENFYKKKNYNLARELFEKSAEKMKEAVKIKIELNNEKKEIDIINMNIHYLLERASISQAFAYISENIENQKKIIDSFKLAEIHNDMEIDFAAQYGDIERIKKVKARKNYCEGQISRLNGRIALEEGDILKAKEFYLKASEFFNKSNELDNNWDEYKIMAKRMLKVANRLRVPN